MDKTEIIESILRKQAERYGLQENIIRRSLSWIEENRAGIIEFESISRSAECSDPPGFLFYWGDLSVLEKFRIAFVGTRKPDGYGRHFVESAAAAYRGANVSTVSGFASGIDSAVHNESLKNGVSTVAVTGSGFAVNYPAENRILKKKIAESGLMLSEYSPFIRASRVNLINRNRIIAAISDAVVIVQGGERSGTLNTLNWAIKMKKRVFALPGNIENSLSFAPNYALSRGGECIVSIDSLPRAERGEKVKMEFSDDEAVVLKLVKEHLTSDDIMNASPFTKEKLFSIIIKLELKGAVRRDFNGTIYTTED